MALETTTSSNLVKNRKTEAGVNLGQSTSDLVGFWGTTPCDQPAAITAATTTITMADAAGTPDVTFAAVTSTSPFGFSNAAEAITLLYTVQNLQVRVGELEARLEECGIIAAN
jgi:hypothetical protein